jgi:hypothetical protein
MFDTASRSAPIISAAFSLPGILAATQNPSMGGPSRFTSCHRGNASRLAWAGAVGVESHLPVAAGTEDSADETSLNRRWCHACNHNRVLAEQTGEGRINLHLATAAYQSW